MAILKAYEVWGALRGKLILFTLSYLFRAFTNFMADQEPADHRLSLIQYLIGSKFSQARRILRCVSVRPLVQMLSMSDPVAHCEYILAVPEISQAKQKAV